MIRSKITVARRSIQYVMRTLLILAAVVILALGAFTTAMHMSNIFILVSEGMELRAETVLKNGDLSELTEYFTEDFIENDPLLHSEKYKNFTVTSQLYKLQVHWFFVLPWDASASVRVTERMLSLSGTPNDDTVQDTDLPAWPAALYTVKLRKMKGRWYISDLKLVEQNPASEPLPTPDYSLLPSPAPAS